MEQMNVMNEVLITENATPKGDDDSVQPEKAPVLPVAPAVFLSSGDSPAMVQDAAETPMEGLKEQSEYAGDDIKELSLHDIETNAKEGTKPEDEAIEPSFTGHVGGENTGSSAADSVVLMGGRVLSDDPEFAEEDDFVVIEEPEDIISEQIDMLINNIILAQVQQNIDDIISPEGEQALRESSNDFATFDFTGNCAGTEACADGQYAAGSEEVDVEWVVLDATEASGLAERSASEVQADEEVEEIMEAIAASEKSREIHQGREWRPLGSEELMATDDHTYCQHEQEADVDYNNFVCQQCAQSIEHCGCGEGEVKITDEGEQRDGARNLPRRESRAPETAFNDSCDGDVEDSCSQTDESEMAAARNRVQHHQKQQGVQTSRPQPRRQSRGQQPSEARPKKEGKENLSIEERKERLSQRIGCFIGVLRRALQDSREYQRRPRNAGQHGNRNNEPRPFYANQRRPREQEQSRRPPPKQNTSKRRPEKISKKYLAKLQDAADRGDVYAAAKIVGNKFNVVTEIDDLGHGKEVIMHLPYYQLKGYVREQTEKIVNECEDYWKKEVKKEQQSRATILLEACALKQDVKKLKDELEKADTESLELQHMVDQLKEEVQRLREGKRRRSTNKKHRKGVEKQMSADGSDESSVRKTCDY